MRKVCKIEPTIAAFQARKRVAAYARVSEEKGRTMHSFSAQVSFYSAYIQKQREWVYAGVYADEGFTGTSDNREAFKRLLADCELGKIDIILTKSISRFARNTVDLLETVRRLRDLGVEVRFEKEHINSLSGDGELMLSILASFAQEESRSISENVTWGQRKRFADGKVTVPFARFLGYDRGEDGNLILNEKEAIIIKRIFSMFLQGMTPYGIATELTADGILSPGKKDKWNATTIRGILSNEKYKGDALLQKSYTVDFLTKKKKVNEGEIPQYYVENNHEAIIDPAVFDMAQREIERRLPGRSRHSGVHMFSGKIKCGECGSWYGSKVWHSNSKYRRTIWQCNNKFNGDRKCKTPHLDEDNIKQLFITAVNKLLTDKDEILTNFESIQNVLFDTESLEMEKAKLQNEMEVVTEMIQQCINENAHVALDQTQYQKRYDDLIKRFESTKSNLESVSGVIKDKANRRNDIECFLSVIKNQKGLLTDFDPLLWHSLVDIVTVYMSGNVRLTFKNGTDTIINE